LYFYLPNNLVYKINLFIFAAQFKKIKPHFVFLKSKIINLSEFKMKRPKPVNDGKHQESQMKH